MIHRCIGLACLIGFVGCAGAQMRKSYVASDTKDFETHKAIALAKDLESLVHLLVKEAEVSVLAPHRSGIPTAYYNRFAEFKGAGWNLKSCLLAGRATQARLAWMRKPKSKRGPKPKKISAFKEHLKRTLNLETTKHNLASVRKRLSTLVMVACREKTGRDIVLRLYNFRRRDGWYSPETIALMDKYIALKKGRFFVPNKAHQTRQDERKKTIQIWLGDDQLSPELKLHLVTIDWTHKAANKKVRMHKFQPSKADLAIALRQIERLEAERVRGEARRVTNECVSRVVARPGKVQKLDKRIESLTKRYDTRKHAGVKKQLENAKAQRSKLLDSPRTCELPRWNDWLWDRYDNKGTKYRQGTWRKALCAPSDERSLLQLTACSERTMKSLPKALRKAISEHQNATKLRRGRYRYASMAKKEDLPEFLAQCEQQCEQQAAVKMGKNRERQAKRAADKKKSEAKERLCNGLGAKLEKVRLRWKKCMSNADLQRTARRYAVTDEELYDNHMSGKAMQCIGSSKNTWRKFVKAPCACYQIEGSYSYKLRHRKSVSACRVSEAKWGPK